MGGDKMSTSWRIELLGGPRAIQGERVITRFRIQKVGALLAYLSYYGDRIHSRSARVELLWPDCPPGAAHNSLR
jgi:DNA-binding SARP family transcriptional activator